MALTYDEILQKIQDLAGSTPANKITPTQHAELAQSILDFVNAETQLTGDVDAGSGTDTTTDAQTNIGIWAMFQLVWDRISALVARTDNMIDQEFGTWTPLSNDFTLSGQGRFYRIGNFVRASFRGDILPNRPGIESSPLHGLPFFPAPEKNVIGHYVSANINSEMRFNRINNGIVFIGSGEYLLTDFESVDFTIEYYI